MSIVSFIILLLLELIVLESTNLDNGDIEVEVYGCDGWEYGSISHSLQIQLKSEYDSTPFFYVNSAAPLPTYGHSKIFKIKVNNHNFNYNNLYSIVISFTDSYDYCLKGLSINNKYKFENNYFGNGLILSNCCKYSYKSISKHKPLIRCIDDYLELYAYYPRAIYKLNIHTCPHKDSGISSIEMKNNVYTVLMGKKMNRNVYKTTDNEYLDHYKIGDINLNKLGHLIAGNIKIYEHSYESHELYTRNINGKIIGIKIESVNNIFNDKIEDEFKVKINGERRHVHDSMILGNGKYFIVFLSHYDRINIKEDTEIIIYGFKYTHVNVYIILNGYYKLYELPFIIVGNDIDYVDYYNKYNDAQDAIKKNKKEEKRNKQDGTNTNTDTNTNTVEIPEMPQENGINWFDANTSCSYMFGTSLTSIHSKDESFLINGFVGHHSAWIGFVDFDINVMEMHYMHNNHKNNQCQWKWYDGSYIDYMNWKSGEPGNYDSDADENCACVDGKRGGGWRSTDCYSTSKAKFACSSPYWYPNSKRNFEINIDSDIDGYIDDISIITIHNNNINNSLCINSISISDEHSAIELTNNWIGGIYDDKSLNAIFKYPVCSTEVIDMNIMYNTLISDIIIEWFKIPNLSCTNLIRIGEKPECTAALGIDLPTKTQFKISDVGMSTDYVSFASESIVTLNNDNQITTTNEFTFDKYYAINLPNNIKPLWLMPSIEFYDIEDYDHDDDDDEYNFNNNNNYDRYHQQLWESAKLEGISCTGRHYAPPAFKVHYEVFANKITFRVNVFVDLKLTLCKSFLKSSNSEIIYIKNVPSEISHFEPTTCNSRWVSFEYIPNKHPDCFLQQQIAISDIGETHRYVPRCDPDNYNLYDPCQCNEHFCWCVDSIGNKVGVNVTQLGHGELYVDTCLRLNCSISDRNSMDTTTTSSPLLPNITTTLVLNETIFPNITTTFFTNTIAPSTSTTSTTSDESEEGSDDER